ncbi:MAG: hypothetical protein ACFFFT_06710 [Candidatus Thorarchaeota archaeon]
MGFGKSFLLSLVAFVGLNFIFTILYFLIDVGQSDPGFEALMDKIQDDPLMIIYYLFGSITSVPSNNLDWAIFQPLFNEESSYLIFSLGYLATPIIAAILAGKFAESKFQGFAGWMLTVVISTVAVVIGVFLNQAVESEFSTLFYTFFIWPSPITVESILIYLVISCIVNIVFYSFFVLLVSKTEYY